jgi:hypothetical protein
MEEAGIEPLVAGSVPSIRLAGMGGLWLAVTRRMS